MTTEVAEIVALGALWGFVAVMAALATVSAVRFLLPGPHRDARDDARVLLAYLDAWDLTAEEIGRASRLSPGRAATSLCRLRDRRLIDAYRPERSAIIRFSLTDLGRESVYDVERARIAEALDDRGDP